MPETGRWIPGLILIDEQQTSFVTQLFDGFKIDVPRSLLFIPPRSLYFQPPQITKISHLNADIFRIA